MLCGVCVQWGAFNSPRQLKAPDFGSDCYAILMSRGWADTAPVLWLCTKATNCSVSMLRGLVPTSSPGCFSLALEVGSKAREKCPGDEVGLVPECVTCFIRFLLKMQKQKHWFFYVSFIQGEEINVHPWYLMLPAAISCSFTFMLHIATPPNAIIFAGGHLKVKDMVCIDCNQRGFLLTTH